MSKHDLVPDRLDRAIRAWVDHICDGCTGHETLFGPNKFCFLGVGQGGPRFSLINLRACLVPGEVIEVVCLSDSRCCKEPKESCFGHHFQLSTRMDTSQPWGGEGREGTATKQNERNPNVNESNPVL